MNAIIAKSISEKHQSSEIKESLKDVFAYIRIQAETGRYQIVWCGDFSHPMKRYLEGLGYKVKADFENETATISW